MFPQEESSLCLPRKSMGTRLSAAVSVFAGILAWFSSSASGQIASYIDERGKRVFVNADSPTRPVTRPRTPRMTSLEDSRVPHPGPETSGRGWGSSPRWRSVAVRPSANASRRQPPSKEGLELLAHQAAERHRIDPVLVRAIIEAESNWDPAAVSSRGARGLMQLVPATAERFGVADPFDPDQNLEAGVLYLRVLLERYDGDLDKTLAAYNAGEGAVDRAQRVPKFPETQAYVKKVTDSYFRPDSGRLPTWWHTSRPIHRIVDERGRLIFTNE